MSIGHNQIYNSLSDNHNRMISDMNRNRELQTKKYTVSSVSDLAKTKKASAILLNHNDLAHIKNYSDSNNILNSKLLSIDQSLEHILDIATDLKSNLNLLRSASGDAANFENYARDQLQSLQGLLNQSHSGKYLFSGTKTNIAPVKNIDKVSNIIINTVTANYYVGGKQNEYSKIDDNVTLNYGIKADHKSFQELISAFHYGIASVANKEVNDDVFESAFDQVNNSIESLISLRTSLGHHIKSIEKVESINDKSKQSIEKLLSNEMGVDILEKAREISKQHTQLIASYKATNKIQGMSLANYV